MRKTLLFCVLLLCGAGCTSYQLQQSTLNQAGTLTDLQYQQVLNNLAMFAANDSAIPWQINLKDGSAQVADLGSLAVVGTFGHMMGKLATGAPSFVGSRTVVEQWGTTPVTDDTELRLLQIAYRRAFGKTDTLDDEGFADDLAHELKKQVSVTDDLKDFYKFLYADIDMQATIQSLFEDLNKAGISRTKYDILGVLVLATNDDKIVQDGELVAAKTFESARTNKVKLGDELFVSESEKPKRSNTEDDPTELLFAKRATPVIQEVRRLLKKTEDDLEAIHPLWFGVACHKHDVPKDACYVGYYKDRCGERYVWVCSGQRNELTRFTLTILSLSSLLKDSQLVTMPGGPRYAPPSAFSR